ncbi:hypothetical protein MCM1_0739 [Methanosarcina barkeri CM1]|uniref:Uncharacterized protein n=1 Tax=Methanosarcina barkeri CM1 TaxID=796385 RepID=A0A0G3C752_METBA|nr:hypothetical protein MCM1_0739 [Methanosarcina barkeri CM1]
MGENCKFSVDYYIFPVRTRAYKDPIPFMCIINSFLDQSIISVPTVIISTVIYSDKFTVTTQPRLE